MLTNISKIKGNQAMKFGQLIECNMRNIFLEKSYTKCGGETSPRSFSEKVWQVEGYRNILKLSCRPLAFTSYKAFLKNKKRSGTSLPASFSAWFLMKNISLVLNVFRTK